MNRAGTSGRFVELTDYLAAQLTDASINIAPEFDPVELFEQVTSPVLKGILDAVMEGRLTEAEATAVASIIKSGHVFCSLCVLVLKVWEAGEDLASILREKGVDQIVDLMFGGTALSLIDAAARGIVRGALLAGFNAAWDALKAAAQVDVTIKALRFLGLITCPNIDTHPSDEVTIYCLTPLAAELLSKAFTEWIESRFSREVSAKEQANAQLN